MFLTKENKFDLKRTLLWAAITCVIVLLGVFTFDVPLFNLMRTFDCRFCDVMGVIFAAKTWLVVSAIVVLVFYIRKTIRAKSGFGLVDFYDKVRSSYAFLVFESVALASITGAVLKFVIGRARPIFYEAIGMTGFFPFTRDAAFHSMPSGHAMASFAGLIMIALLAPRGKWFLWALAILIGVSRICAGMHWPSDVIFGAFWGAMCACIVRALTVRSHDFNK